MASPGTPPTQITSSSPGSGGPSCSRSKYDFPPPPPPAPATSSPTALLKSTNVELAGATEQSMDVDPDVDRQFTDNLVPTASVAHTPRTYYHAALPPPNYQAS